MITSANVLASLSADGKTLTLTAQSGENFNGRYAVDIDDTVKSSDGQYLAKYSQIVDTTDETQPAVTGVSYQDNGLTAKIAFSEPLNSAGTIKLFNGATELSITPAFTSGDDYALVPLGASTIPVNTSLTLQVTGAVDFNGNAITPNPYTTTIVKSTSDTTAPTVTSIEVVNDEKVKVTFSEKLGATPTITIGGAPATVTAADSTGLVYYAAVGSPVSGLTSVDVATFADLASNAGTEYAKVVDMEADTTAPTLVSSQVVNVDGVEKLILTFSEDVTPQDAVTVLGAADRYTNKDGINVAYGTTFATSTSGTPNFALYNATDGVSKSVALDITALPEGTYDLALPAGIVKDLASTPMAYAEGKEITFKRTENTLTQKPALDTSVSTNGVTVVDNNTLQFNFTQPLSDAAKNVANFNIDGMNLDSVEFYGNNSTIRVTLKAGANTVTGVHTITVKNIANTSGLVMNTATTTETMKENVAPTYTATLVAADVIRLDFSEPIAESTLATALGASNFTVKVNGTGDTVTAVNADNTATPTAVSGSNGYKTVYLKLTAAVTDLTKPVTVSVSGIQDVTVTGASAAAIGNSASSTVVNVSK